MKAFWRDLVYRSMSQSLLLTPHYDAAGPRSRGCGDLGVGRDPYVYGPSAGVGWQTKDG